MSEGGPSVLGPEVKTQAVAFDHKVLTLSNIFDMQPRNKTDTYSRGSSYADLNIHKKKNNNGHRSQQLIFLLCFEARHIVGRSRNT